MPVRLKDGGRGVTAMKGGQGNAGEQVKSRRYFYSAVLSSGQQRARGPETTTDLKANLFILSQTDNKDLKTNTSPPGTRRPSPARILTISSRDLSRLTDKEMPFFLHRCVVNPSSFPVRCLPPAEHLFFRDGGTENFI